MCAGSKSGTPPALLSPQSFAGVVWLTACGDRHQVSRQESVPGVVIFGAAIPDWKRFNIVRNVLTTITTVLDLFAKDHAVGCFEVEAWFSSAVTSTIIIFDYASDRAKPYAWFGHSIDEIELDDGHVITKTRINDLVNFKLFGLENRKRGCHPLFLRIFFKKVFLCFVYCFGLGVDDQD